MNNCYARPPFLTRAGRPMGFLLFYRINHTRLEKKKKNSICTIIVHYERDPFAVAWNSQSYDTTIVSLRFFRFFHYVCNVFSRHRVRQDPFIPIRDGISCDTRCYDTVSRYEFQYRGFASRRRRDCHIPPTTIIIFLINNLRFTNRS